MAADLTVDNLCEAIRHFLKQIVDHPEQPVDQDRGITMWGTPADATMKTLMEIFGGAIKITVREAPVGISEEAVALGIVEAQGANIWHPGGEVDVPKTCAGA